MKHLFTGENDCADAVATTSNKINNVVKFFMLYVMLRTFNICGLLLPKVTSVQGSDTTKMP